MSLPAYYILNKIKIFDDLNIIEKSVLILAGSISAINILLVYFGQLFSSGLRSFAIFIFTLCLIFTLLSIKYIIRDATLIITSIFQKGPYSLLFILLFILIAKITFFYILRPVVDPDIVSQYLTYARSIVLSNRIPNLDLFTLNPVTTPPIGGPMLFSFYYLIVGNLKSEGFRLLTYPFLMGIIALMFLISKKIFRSTWLALLSSIIFLSFPIIDNLLLEWALYPDIIATFLELLIIYFVLFKNSYVINKSNHMLDVILGLSAAEMLLLKSQSVLFFVMVTTLVLLRAKIFKHSTYILGCLLATIMLLLPIVNLFGLSSFRLGNINTISYLLLSIPVLIILVLGYKNREPIFVIKPVSMGIVGSITLTGTIWLIRNYFLFGSFLSANNAAIFKSMFLQSQIFVNGIGQGSNLAGLQSFNNAALMALPIFGTLFFIPKMAGMISAVFKQHWNFVVLLMVFWYALIVIYSGYPNERYLFGIFPFLGTLIVYGAICLTDWIFPHMLASKKKQFGLVVVILSAVFSLSQSIILSWGFGSQFYTSSELRQIVLVATPTVQQLTSVEGLKVILLGKLIWIIRLLNIRSGIFLPNDLGPSLLLGFFVSLFVLICSFLLIKFVFRNKLKWFITVMAGLLIVPYFVLILQTTGGNIKKFPNKIELNIYNYWGEANNVVPYFSNHHDNSSIILVVGPQTGLSYKIFMKVYNIEYGYGFIEISSVIRDPDPSNIYKYFLDNNIRYILVYEGSDNEIYLKNFEKNSTLYNFVKNQNYFTTEIFPDSNNLWRLYKLKTEM